MFENIGGRRSGKARARRTPTRGGDVEAQINITLEDACHGSAKDIALQPAAGEFSATGSRSLRVKIPPGVTDGSTIRLAGQGQPGENGAPAGDLLLRVKLTPHPRYEVVPGSADLTADVKITPWEAALGAKVDVPTLDGPVSLSIPPDEERSPEPLRYVGRSRRPPANLLKALLNFVYALLQTAVMRSILATGLDHSFGFYHTPRSDAHPLVLDLMELFRVMLWDIVVVGLSLGGCALSVTAVWLTTSSRRAPTSGFPIRDGARR